MEDAHNPSLKQGPHVFDAIGMDITIDIGFPMLHGAMGKLRAIEPDVGAKFVGIDAASLGGVAPNELRKGGPFHILHRLHTDVT